MQVTAENLHVARRQVEMFPRSREELAAEAKARRPICYPLRVGDMVRVREHGCVRRITWRCPDPGGKEYRYRVEGFEETLAASEVEKVG